MEGYAVIEEGLYAGEGCISPPSVDAVICLDPTCRVLAEGVEEYCYEVEEMSIEPLGNFSRALAKLIELRRKNFKVYVHCMAGCGRTGTLVSAYLILTRDWTAEKAIGYYRLARGCGPESWEQEEFLYSIAKIRSLGVEKVLGILLSSYDFGDFLGRIRGIV